MRECDFCRRKFKPRSARQRFCCPEHRFAAKASADGVRYGRDHRRLRAQLKGLVEAGRASCSRCGGVISPLEPWDLANGRR